MMIEGTAVLAGGGSGASAAGGSTSPISGTDVRPNQRDGHSAVPLAFDLQTGCYADVPLTPGWA